MNRKRTAQPSSRGQWGEDLYSSVAVDAEDVFCSGSDDEYYESPAERERRLVAAAQRFLQHGKPYIMTSTLMGPFEAESGWTNPWSSKRQKQQTSNRFRSSYTRKTHIEAPVASNQHRAARDKTKATHLPTPESLNEAHIVCSEPLSSNSRIRQWQKTVVASESTASPLSDSPSISQPVKRKAVREPTILGPRKRSRPLGDSSGELGTPPSVHSQPQSVLRTKGHFHAKDCAHRHEAKDSNDELLVISPSPFRSQNSDPAGTLSVPSKRSPVKEFFASHSSNSDDELGPITLGNGKPTTPCTPTASESSLLLEDSTCHHILSPSGEASVLELDNSQAIDDDFRLSRRVAAKYSTQTSLQNRNSTPKTPTRQLHSASEDESSSDDDSMSVISDSGMRALSVELNHQEECTISPRRSARLRPDLEIILPSIIVDAPPEAGSGAKNNHVDVISNPTETESMAKLDLDTCPEMDIEADSSQRGGDLSRVARGGNQTSTDGRELPAGLSTDQCANPIKDLIAVMPEDTFAPSHGVPLVLSDGEGSEHKSSPKPVNTVRDSKSSEVVLGTTISPEPQTPRSTGGESVVRTPEALGATPQTPTGHGPEVHMPTFASFMSPSPQRLRKQAGLLARQRQRKSVAWAPLPDGREDRMSWGSGDTHHVRLDTLQIPRRMASPPPDSEALDAALQEDQSLGQLFTTLNNKEGHRPRLSMPTEPVGSELPTAKINLDQTAPDDQEMPETMEASASKEAILPSDEDAWLDMVMDSVGTELTTHSWDDTGADQLVAEVL